MPGTFYRAEGPGMAPFVEVGAQVEPDTVVCLIEIMKMMNSVQAGRVGDDRRDLRRGRRAGGGRRAAVPGPLVSERVEIVDTTTRDGNQSLWGATGLTTPDVLAIAPTMDRVGFRALDFTSSTHMAVSVRFHREDPWERLRLVSAAMPDTPLNLITTGMRFISWVPAGEDVMALSFRLAVRNGIRRFQIADPSNDPASLVRLARMVREAGAEEVVVGLTYSISPVHTHEYYAERARAVAGSPDIDRLYLKDPGGLLTPGRGARADAAVRRRGRAAAGRAAQPLHDRAGPARLRRGAARRGAHAAHGGRAGGERHLEPARGVDAAQPRGGGLRRTTSTPKRWRQVSDYFRALARDRGLPLGAPAEYDAAYYRHQMPGGMVTTTRRMLAELGRPELFDAVLEEVTRVRAEMGYPIMVTPVSQFVATQATMNVVGGERWRDVSDELVRYFHGHFYEPPAPVDPEVADRVLSTPRAAELRSTSSRSAWRGRASASGRASPRRSCCCG